VFQDISVSPVKSRFMPVYARYTGGHRIAGRCLILAQLQTFRLQRYWKKAKNIKLWT